MFCKKCGAELNGAPFCKKCGTRNAVHMQPPFLIVYQPQPRPRTPIHKSWWFWFTTSICAVFLIMTLLAALFLHSLTLSKNSADIPEVPQISETEYKALCSEKLNYEAILEDSEKHAGEKYFFRVKIDKSGVALDESCYYGNTVDENNKWSGNRFQIVDCRYDKSSRIRIGHVITVYGEYAGWVAEPDRSVGGSGMRKMITIKMYYCDIE
jgi:hypothetical protein